MKFLILACTFLATLAYAQEETISKDPQSDLYKTAHTAGAVVDIKDSHGTQMQYHGLPFDKSCPGCSLHGDLNLTDENGVPVTAADGSPVKTGGAGNGTIGQ